MGGPKRPMKYGQVRVEPDDAEVIRKALEIVRQGAPKYWKNHGLPLAFYRLEKELVRVRGSNTTQISMEVGK